MSRFILLCVTELRWLFEIHTVVCHRGECWLFGVHTLVCHRAVLIIWGWYNWQQDSDQTSQQSLKTRSLVGHTASLSNNKHWKGLERKMSERSKAEESWTISSGLSSSCGANGKRAKLQSRPTLGNSYLKIPHKNTGVLYSSGNQNFIQQQPTFSVQIT